MKNGIDLGPPLEIIGYENATNLNKITWNQFFLEKIKKEYKLKHRQAVLYVNQAQDRFRLVACFYDLAVLILPPTDPEHRLSIYIKVGSFLRKFAQGFQDAQIFIDHEVEHAEKKVLQREKRRKSHAQQILSRRRSK